MFRLWFNQIKKAYQNIFGDVVIYMADFVHQVSEHSMNKKYECLEGPLTVTIFAEYTSLKLC